MVEWDLTETYFRRAWSGCWPGCISERSLDFFSGPGNERFLLTRPLWQRFSYFDYNGIDEPSDLTDLFQISIFRLCPLIYLAGLLVCWFCFWCQGTTTQWEGTYVMGWRPARGETKSDELTEWQGVCWICWLDVVRSISFWCAFIESCSPDRWITQSSTH